MAAMRTVLLTAAIVATFATVGPERAMAKTEEPKFTVEQEAGEIQVRRYGPQIVAEVEATGDRDGAINGGFRILANYIFGGNIAKKSIDMTAPVTQQASEKITMTAPVTQQRAAEGTWKVQFIMPEGATLATLPQPKDARVTLIEKPGRTFAVVRFSGWSTVSNLESNLSKLKAFIASNALKTAGEPIYAFYDPPWTLPFWRRNEIMFELAQ
jgi:hypothetical protein